MIFQRRVHATNDELSAYLDGRLGAGSRQRVGGHVDGCAICRQVLDGLRAVQTSLRGLRAKAPRSFALREAAVRPVRARSGGGLSGALPLLSGVTAMAMIAFFAVVGVDMSGGGSSTSSEGTKAQPGVVFGLARDTGSGADAAQSLTVTVSSSLLSQTVVGTPPGAAQSLTVTVSSSLLRQTVAGTPPEATPALAKSVSSGTGSDTWMHVAEAALAAVALVSGGSAVAVARRRRAT